MPVIKDYALTKIEQVINELQNLIDRHAPTTIVVLSTSESVLISEEEEGTCVLRQSALRFDTEDGDRYVQVTYEMSESELSANFNTAWTGDKPAPKPGIYTYWLCDIEEMTDMGIPQASGAAWKIKELNDHFRHQHNLIGFAAVDMFNFLVHGMKPPTALRDSITSDGLLNAGFEYAAKPKG